MQSLPPLPPLTPISKLQSMRKTPSIEQQHQQTIQYKTAIHSSASMNLPKSSTILKNVCFANEEDEVNFVQSNMKLIRQPSKEQTIAPKKSLPHKKRITKKLKSISPSVDQMHNEHIYHPLHDISHLHRQAHHEPTSYALSNQHQNETLDLAMNHQPIQLTTSRVNHHSQSAAQSEYLQPDHYANAADTTNSIHQLQQIPIAESVQQTIQTSRFACEICGMQAQTQLSFYNHLKLHYEPETVSDCSKMETIRNANTTIASTLAMEQSDQNIYHLDNERKIAANQCIANQNAPVIMSDNFVRLQNNEQDFSCITGIGNEDVTEDESINGYNDNGIKSEQNEFSDTEDMLENGFGNVLDKVQRVVDSYIENGTSEVKNLIDMNENQHHWAANNAHNTVYALDKNEPVNGMNSSGFVIASNNQNKEQIAQNHLIDNQSAIERPEELTLIYEINVNDKDFSMMDDTSTESEFKFMIFKFQLIYLTMYLVLLKIRHAPTPIGKIRKHCKSNEFKSI